jgi:tetratricopeptide (TPR) repeat protein
MRRNAPSVPCYPGAGLPIIWRARASDAFGVVARCYASMLSARKLPMQLAATAACALILRCLGVLLGATLFVLIAMAPAAAQQGDLNAIVKRYNEFMDAANYAAALVEAQKFEAVAKARFGVNHANYGAALHNLALVYTEKGEYAEAEALYKRALVGLGEHERREPSSCG